MSAPLVGQLWASPDYLPWGSSKWKRCTCLGGEDEETKERGQ